MLAKSMLRMPVFALTMRETQTKNATQRSW